MTSSTGKPITSRPSNFVSSTDTSPEPSPASLPRQVSETFDPRAWRADQLSGRPEPELVGGLRFDDQDEGLPAGRQAVAVAARLEEAEHGLGLHAPAAQRAGPADDEAVLEGVDLSAERTKRPFSGSIDEMLLEIGALTSDRRPTTAGILLFSEYPQKWLPQSSLIFARFVGNQPRGESGMAGYIRREEITGPLPRLR